ncbi:MAG: TraB/GumN family protein [Rhodopila sp.]|nr:TraB/GumN family protein [Rhodopila sp.]
MLWHVEDTNLHLMGSIHVLGQTRHGLFPEAEQVYKSAQRVTFEHDMGQPPALTLLENVAGAALSTQVPPAVFASAAREWANLGLDPARLEQLQPWAAAFAIVAIGAAKRGIDQAYGVDKVLWVRTDQDGKERTTLEQPADALTIFALSPTREKVSLLNYATNPPSAFQNDMDVMIKAWHDHDAGTFEHILDHRLRMWPVGFEKLITGRNSAWMPDLVRLASDGIPTLVVVGALHCVGKDGIPTLLEGQGVQVSRVI